MLDLRVGDKVAWQLLGGEHLTGNIYRICDDGVWVKVYSTVHAIFLKWDEIKTPF